MKRTFKRILAGLVLFLSLGCSRTEQPRIEPAPKKPGMVLLKDQRPITDPEYAQAMAAWSQGKKSFDERANYLKSKGLDPAIYLPSLGWADNKEGMIPLKNMLAGKPSRSRVDQLRFYTYPFTGYSLYHFAKSEGGTPPPENISPEEFDNNHRDLPPDPSVAAFKHLHQMGIPEKYLTQGPRVMGEIGWELDGQVVNLDIVAYQQSMAILYETGVLGWLETKIASGKPLTVLEIGSGYGGFPYVFTRAFPKVNYWACDLPESLTVAAMYLSVTLPEHWRGVYPSCGESCQGPGLIGLPNYRFEEFAGNGRKVDLVINMMSLSEMPEIQVRYYARKVSELLGDQGVFFEQNYDNRNMGLTSAKELLPGYFKAHQTLGESFNRGITHLWANDSSVLTLIEKTKPGRRSTP